MNDAMERIVYVGGVSLKGTPNVYQCVRCGAWHWGHRKEEMG